MLAASAAPMRRSASADNLTSATAGAAKARAPAHQQQRRQGLALRFRGLPMPGLPVPSEMWGATALAVRLTQHPPAGAPPLPRAASVIAQVLAWPAAVPGAG